MSVGEGDMAPEFEMPATGGRTVSLAGLKGKPFVLYFYPKADTPGCTTESQDFSALVADFEQIGTTVIGVSRDPVKKLDRFKAKHDLKVVLASDEPEDVTEAFGVWVEKTLYGRAYMGIERTTMLIDAQGKIARIWSKEKVPGHAEEVLAAAQKLT